MTSCMQKIRQSHVCMRLNSARMTPQSRLHMKSCKFCHFYDMPTISIHVDHFDTPHFLTPRTFWHPALLDVISHFLPCPSHFPTLTMVGVKWKCEIAYMFRGSSWRCRSVIAVSETQNIIHGMLQHIDTHTHTHTHTQEITKMSVCAKKIDV